MINLLFLFLINLLNFGDVEASTLIQPPYSALLVGFESTYELSLVSNTLSDQQIDSILLLPTKNDDIYENLIDVKVIRLNLTFNDSATKDERALKACQELLSNKKIGKIIKETLPTFTIFPPLRHDICLIPFAKSIGSVPIVWTGDAENEMYAIEATRMAIPIQFGDIFSRFWTSIKSRSVISQTESKYIPSAIDLVNKYLPNETYSDPRDYYSTVELFLWDTDLILRSNFATLTPRIIQIGCHHCRGVQPLSKPIQKNLIEFRMGIIAVTLKSDFFHLINQLANLLPQDREGQAVVWIYKKSIEKTEKNLFIYSEIDRQDLIGNPRTRVLLSHCSDIELLEAGFHGTPVVCFPRNINEKNNALRVVQLGYAVIVDENYTADSVYKIVKNIHENAGYRENARKISSAIRDKPIPPSDYLIFWLRYIARNKNNEINKYFLIHKNTNMKTLNEDLQLFYGLCLGIILGSLFSATAALTWIYQNKINKNIKSKIKRHHQ